MEELEPLFAFIGIGAFIGLFFSAGKDPDNAGVIDLILMIVAVIGVIWCWNIMVGPTGPRILF